VDKDENNNGIQKWSWSAHLLWRDVNKCLATKYDVAAKSSFEWIKPVLLLAEEGLGKIFNE
jgi:hypothetical protein